MNIQELAIKEFQAASLVPFDEDDTGRITFLSASFHPDSIHDAKRVAQQLASYVNDVSINQTIHICELTTVQKHDDFYQRDMIYLNVGYSNLYGN